MLSRLAVGTRSMSSSTQPPLDLQHTTLLNQRIDETFAGRFELELPVPQTSNGWQLSARQKSDNASVVITGVPFDGLTAGRRLRLIHETARIRGASSPHTQMLLELVEQEDVLWLVWESAEGNDLQRRLRQGRLPLVEALTLAEHMFLGLDFYHGHGTRHRDLRPAHLIETPQGWKIINFGGAAARGQSYRQPRRPFVSIVLFVTGAGRVNAARYRTTSRSVFSRRRTFRVPCRPAALSRRHRGRSALCPHDRSCPQTCRAWATRSISMILWIDCYARIRAIVISRQRAWLETSSEFAALSSKVKLSPHSSWTRLIRARRSWSPPSWVVSPN